MMGKKISKAFRLSKKSVRIIREKREKINFKTETQVVDLALDMLDRYFDDNEIKLEHDLFDYDDGRKNRNDP